MIVFLMTWLRQVMPSRRLCLHQAAEPPNAHAMAEPWHEIIF
ncbi:hypothetical protein VB712_03235 [Spirulina sp. CCNP1310]|nr:hypothetical protein [Spirulina sp. CCNP1310]MEA5418223.1 hypothetical protein [Spirulina sp. CCNP1310]